MKKARKRKLLKIKKGIIGITILISFLIIIGEPEQITISNILLRFTSLFYIWLVAKANNYFYQGERR